MRYASFRTIGAARDWRSVHGGWVFHVPDTGEAIWFAHGATPSEIMTHRAVSGLNGVLI